MAASLIAAMASSVMQPVATSLINAIYGKGIRRVGKGQDIGFLLLSALHLVIKTMSGKEGIRAGKGYNNMGHVEKIF